MGSLGAGLSLAIAGSLALLVVSTVVAFRGWPDDLGSSGAVSVSHLASSAEKTRSRGLPSESAPVLALPAVTAAARGVREVVGRTNTPGRPTTSSPSTSSPIPAASPGTTPSSSPVAAPQPAGRVAPSLKRTTTATGEVVRETTKQVGATVTPVSPAAGKVVEDVGSTAGDVVDKGGSAVADALGSLGH